MGAKTIGSCSCGYPIAASYVGERVTCPMCQTASIAQSITQGVTLPTWLVIGLAAFGAGMILGPAVLASTEAGAKYLEKQVRERVR